jgi:hypothetical protein
MIVWESNSVLSFLICDLVPVAVINVSSENNSVNDNYSRQWISKWM